MLEVLQWLLDNRAAFQHGLLIVVCVSALKWGAGPERLSALTLLVILVSDQIYHAAFGVGVELAKIDVGHAVIDTAAMVAMVLIGITANRIYPLWIGAFQIIAFQSHLARELEQGISPLAYAIVSIVPSYCQIVLLAAGLWYHRRRLRRFGRYRSWRTSSPRSFLNGRLDWLND